MLTVNTRRALDFFPKELSYHSAETYEWTANCGQS